MQKPNNARGTRDFGPQTMVRRNYVFDIIKKNFIQFGFENIETPAIENLNVLMGKYGEEGDQLLFKILNSGDFKKDFKSEDLVLPPEKLITKVSEKGLRYDLTIPFARFVAMNRNELVFPFKRYQIQPVWRADRPQKGRYREFYQCDADIVGSNSLINEVELISLFQSVFSDLGFKANLFINSRKILTGISEVLGYFNNFNLFAATLDKLDKIGWDKVNEELISAGYPEYSNNSLKEILDFKGTNLEKCDYLEGILNSSSIGLEGVAEVRNILTNLDLNLRDNSNIIFDVKLARGLSYYTGLIYEGKPAEIDFPSIVGGGRYDNLTTMFGFPDMSGVGISFGIERILDVMEILNLFQDLPKTNSQILFTYFDEKGQKMAVKYVNQLRQNGIKAEIYPDIVKIKKSFDFANKRNIPFVAVIGEEEIISNKINLKNMNSGTQELISIEDTIQILLN
jgi:histidyl-tRNA synthetase